MPNPYCLLCGNRDKSVSYYTFPKDEESCKKWLDFCGIDKKMLNTATKLCSDHFQNEDIICKVKGTVVKPNAVPSIISKKKEFYQCLNLNICKDSSSKELKDTDWQDEVVDDKSWSDVNVKTEENFEFVSVEDSTELLKESPLSTPPSSEDIQCFEPRLRTVPTLRYVGDITTSHLDTPTKAEMALQIAKRTIEKQRRKIKTLHQARNRLVARVTILNEIIKHLKQQQDGIVKPNAVPSIISKKKESCQSLNLNICKDNSSKELEDIDWQDEVVDDKSWNNVDVKTEENFEFVSVEDSTELLKEKEGKDSFGQ